MERTLGQGGLAWRVLGAWADLRGAMRVELDRAPSDGRLLFYMMLASLIWVVGKLMELSMGPFAPAMTSNAFLARASANIFSLFFLILMMYGLAALAHGIARVAGGTGRWIDSRAAVFWAALVAAPPMLVVRLIAVVAEDPSGRADWAAGTAASLMLGWAMARCLAEAHGLPGLWRGLAVVAAMAALIFAAIFLVVQI